MIDVPTDPRPTAPVRANDAAFAASDDVDVAVCDDELVLFHRRHSSYFGLDAAGSAVWTSLTSGDTIEQAVAALVGRFDVSPEVARADVDQLVDALVAAELLRPH